MKTASRRTNKTHCCQIAQIQQTLIKVQSHKILRSSVKYPAMGADHPLPPVSWWSAMIGGCQAKFKLTQEKQRKWQFQSQTDKIKYKSETVSVIFDTKIAIQSLLTNKTLAFEKFIRKEYQLRFCPCQPELTHRNWWNAFLSLEEITHYSVNRKNVWPFNTGIYNRKCKIMSEKS